MKTSIFPTLNQTMPCEIVERTFKPAPVPSSAACLFHLEYAKTGLKKFYDLVSRDAASSASRSDEHPDNQGPGISIEKAGSQVFWRRRNVTSPILVLLMGACRYQIRCAALGVTKPARAAD